MKRYSPRLALGLLLCTAMVGAQTPTPTAGRSIPNWENADIAMVADNVGLAIGVTFILDQRVRGNISLKSQRSMTRQELLDAFLKVLQLGGFAINGRATVGSGNIVKIVPEAVAMRLPGNDMPDYAGLAGDEVVTDTLELKNLNALQISTILRQWLTQGGQISPVPGTNSMWITDRANNVARIKRLLAQVDQTSNASWVRIPLENAIASEVVRLVTPFITGQPADAAGGTAPKVAADDRTNSVIVSGDPAQRLRIAELVDSLDVAVDNGGGTRVIALKYADAEELAATLKGQVAGTTAAGAGTPGAGAAPAANSAAAAADRSVTILPDVQTNKLIITGPPRTIISLLSIIEELDIPPAQVHIEAIIADVSYSKAADLGVNWAVFSEKEGTKVPVSAFIQPIGGTSIVDLAQAISDPASATNVPLGGTFGVGMLRDGGLNFAVMLRALQTDTKTNVVSTPSVTATNNEESEMNSVKEVPLLSGTYTTTGGGGGGGGGGGVSNPFTTVNRQEVGTILKVTPQIIPGTDEVILKIDLESSGLSGQSGDAGSLITNKRSVKTSVRVRSGATIVIGGMMSDSKDTGDNGVPLLSKIPGLGWLFKSRGSQRDKSMLMIFIKPEILFDALQASSLTRAKDADVREMQRLQNDRKPILPVMPSENPPELPALPPARP
jgi:general secretion pathway protein D